MAVLSGKTSAGPYIGDGEQKVFSFDFPILDPKHVAVYVGGNKVERNISVYGDSTGGRVEFLTAPVKGARVAILRDMPLTQEMDLQNNTAFLPEVLEAAFDRQIMIAQQLSENIGRAATYAPGMEGVTDIAATAVVAVEAAKNAVAAAQETAESLTELRTTQEEVLTEIADSQQSALAELTTKSETTLQIADTAVTQLTEKNAEAQEAYNQVFTMLESADIMGKDSMISLEYTPDVIEDEDYPAWEALYTANCNTLAELPRNLGGHTLTLSFGNQYMADSDGYELDGFYNGEIIVRGHFYYSSLFAVADKRTMLVRDCACPVYFEDCGFHNLKQTNAYAFVWVKNSLAVSFLRCVFDGKFYPKMDVDYPSGGLILSFNSNISFTDDPEESNTIWDFSNGGGNDISGIIVPTDLQGEFQAVRFFDENQQYFAKQKAFNALVERVAELERRLNITN
jgi:hypothetical protein